MDMAMSNMRNKLSPCEHAICAIVETIEKGVLQPGTQLFSDMQKSRRVVNLQIGGSFGYQKTVVFPAAVHLFRLSQQLRR